MVRSEGNVSLKNPVTPPGIDPGTLYIYISNILYKQNRSVRLPEGDEDALKCVGAVPTIYKYIVSCVYIYIYCIYMCV